MELLQGRFRGSAETQLFYRLYQKKSAENILVILHGHGEHSGRYDKFARFLADEPFSIAVYDMRGYGLSEGRRVYIDSFEEFLEDLTAFLNFIEKTQSDKKIYLLGHSLGGLVAAHWAVRYPGRLQALLLSSPFLGLKVPRLIVQLNSFLNHVAPGLIYRNPVYPPHLTHNPDEVRNYKADPLIQRKISVRSIHEVLLYQAKLRQMDRIPLSFPLYVMAAGLEKIVDLQSTQSFFDKVECPRKEMKVFEGFYHEIFNELAQEKVFDYLKNCLSDARKFASH